MVMMLGAAAIWNATAETVNELRGHTCHEHTATLPTFEVIDAAEAGWATGFKIKTAYPGPLFAFQVEDAQHNTMTIFVTPAQYESAFPNPVGKLISWQDGGPNWDPLPNPQADGDTKDGAPGCTCEESTVIGNPPVQVKSSE